MPSQYADLDELVLCCRSDTARDHIKEAVLCYRAGAFRATILSTWVAVVYDFVDKFRDLALDGDKQAESLVNNFEAIHKTADVEKALEFERTLLSVCKDTFDLITPQEYVDLERLSKDRNRCAHPNLIRHGEIYMPTPELARMHLRNVVEHVLQRPPKVGKAAAEQLFKEVQSEYFPIDPKQAIEVLKRGPLARPKENLLREFLMGITSTALKGEVSTLEVAKRLAAITAAHELHREPFLKLVKTHFPKLLSKTPDDGLKFILPLIVRVPELQAAVDDGLKAKLLRCIEKAPAEDLNTVLTAALRIDMFKSTAMERINNLSEDSVAAYLKSRRGKIPDEIIVRATTLYFEAGNYAEANKKAQNLILPAVSSFNREQIVGLFDIAVKNGEIRGSYEFHELLRKIRALKILTPEQLDSEINSRKWTESFADVMQNPPEVKKIAGPSAEPDSSF